MHVLLIKLKNGETRCGTLWQWCPHLGFLSYTDDESGDCVEVRLSDCLSVVQGGGRATAATVGADEDMLAKARKHGWADER